MFNGKRPTALYYNRELQNLRGPLHFGGERSMNLRLTLAMPPHCLILGVAQHELSMQQSARHFCFAKDSCRRWHFAQIQISIPELPFFQRGCLGIQEWSSFISSPRMPFLGTWPSRTRGKAYDARDRGP